MTDQSRNVELVVRAKNLTKKTLTDVAKEIGAVNKAIDDQVAAGKRGEGSLKDLEKSYGRLEDAMKGLLQQQAVIKNFEAQRARLVELQTALAATETRLNAHRTAMENSGKVTKRQETQLASYEKSVVKAGAAVDKQAVRLANMGKAAEELGVDLNDLVGSQDRVLAAGRRLSEGYDKQAAAVQRFDSDLRQAKNAATELAAAAKFDEMAANAARLNKAGEYTRFWAEQLEKLDVEQRKVANTEALNQLADKALAASRGYRTLGAASQSLVQNNRAMATSLREILDPAGLARTTLGGVEEEIRAMAAAAAAAKGPVTDYKAQVAALAASNKALGTQAAGVDAFQRQIEVLRQARAEFVQNRAALAQFAASVRSAEVPTAEMASELNRLKAALTASGQAYTTQATNARTLRNELAAAGIATNNLANVQQRLVNGAKTNVTTMTQLSEAVRKYGTEVKTADSNGGFFASNGRTTLSLVQRLRGEVLALAAAYVGLQGAIGLAGGSLEASNNKVGLQNQLALAVGDDPKAIAAEYEYIRKQADRIGISFEEAAKGYGKFAAAAKLAGRSNQEIRYVAESFLEVGRVANISADDIGGVFKALEQIYSKGKIQAEELRGQLGDRLFGAFEIAAIALKDQFPNLDKAMKDGLITSEQLVAIAEQYRKTVAVRLPTAMESLAANQARLNSAFFDFKVLIAESGFADKYEALIIKISAFFRSSDGVKFAQDLSTGFGYVADALSFLIDHLDEVKLVLEVAFGLKAVALVAGLATTLTTTLIPALFATQASLAATGTAGAAAATTIQAAFIALGAFLVAWSASDYLSQTDWGVTAVFRAEQFIKNSFLNMQGAAESVAVSIKFAFQNWISFATNAVKKGRDTIVNLLADGADAIGANGMAENIRKGLTDGVKEAQIDIKKEVDKIKLRVQDAMNMNKLEADFKIAAGTGKSPLNETASTDPTGTTPRPDSVGRSTFGTDLGKGLGEALKASKAANKLAEQQYKQRIALAEELTRALEAAEGKIDKNTKDSLEARLKAIDVAYQATFRKIETMSQLPGGAADAAAAKATLTTYIEQLKAQETVKFNLEQQKAQLKEIKDEETRINELIALRTQLLANVEIQRKNGGITDNEAKTQVATIDANYVPQIQQAVTSTMALAEANKLAFGDTLAFDNFQAKLAAIPGSLKTVKNELISVQQVNDKVAGGLANSFMDMADAIARGEDGIKSLMSSFLAFAASFLREIALMIVKQIILNMLQNSSIGGLISGGASSAAGSSISSVGASQMHTGGIVGRSGGVSRNIAGAAFANAPSYHTGGVMGLASDEYPTILQKNEEVLAAGDPRNILNQTAAPAAAAPVPQDIKVINAIDSASVVEEGLNSPQGTRVLLNFIKANKTSVKSLLGT